MQQQSFSTSRGSVAWGLNVFRSFLLTHFLEDLRRLEISGLSRDQCNLVQDSLREIIAEIDRAPQGFEKGILREKLSSFLEVYKSWNESHGDSPVARNNRRAELKKLTHRRKKISQAFAKRQKAFATDLDGKFFLELWSSLEKIPAQHPREFKRLSIAINRSRAILKKENGK